jgi:hypothetical protein
VVDGVSEFGQRPASESRQRKQLVGFNARAIAKSWLRGSQGPGVVPVWGGVPGFGCVRRGVLTWERGSW